MRKYTNDYWLWGLISGGLLITFTILGFVSEGIPRNPVVIQHFISDTVFAGVAFGVFGWVFHAFLVMCGFRLSKPAVDAQAQDYDDAVITPKIGEEASKNPE